MANEGGEWIMRGLAWDDPFRIRTWRELINYINQVGFLPLFANEVSGFSAEEHVSPDFWWTGDPEQDPWEWREIIARTGEVAYGKFFNRKAGFVSKQWFPAFANYRRDGYDFDARWDDELASYREKKIMDVFRTEKEDDPSAEFGRKVESNPFSEFGRKVESNPFSEFGNENDGNPFPGFGSEDDGKLFSGFGSESASQTFSFSGNETASQQAAPIELFSFELKEKAGFGHRRKGRGAAGSSNEDSGGEKNFEGTVTELQMQTYLTVRDFRRRRRKKDNIEYGWPISVYTTAEALIGAEAIAVGYHEDPAESRRRCYARIQEEYPWATEEQIHKVMK